MSASESSCGWQWPDFCPLHPGCPMARSLTHLKGSPLSSLARCCIHRWNPRWCWLEPQAEGMTGRVAQDSPAFRRGLLSFFDGSESDRLCLGVVEVVGVVDGEVEMDLL